MSKNKTIDLRKAFLGLQEEMESRFLLNRKIIFHPVTKGDATEYRWANMLRTYLPKRYQVANKAFVLDSKGKLSDQIDIVIFDQHYSPFLFNQDNTLYIPAESIYAVIEVKPTLNGSNIKYASEKAASVRKLKRTSAPIYHAGGVINNPKKPFNILAGILTIDSKYTVPLKANLFKLPKEKFLHFGCSLTCVSFWYKNKGKNKYKFEKSSQEESLIFFFINLLDELQRLGTAPAIDLKEYLKTFKNS
ncbi:MAG: hypothetical protein HZA49_05555 [Planctomycetes bacterium]|nr:hypothetical protein [Planctomycetota bacterium]